MVPLTVQAAALEFRSDYLTETKETTTMMKKHQTLKVRTTTTRPKSYRVAVTIIKPERREVAIRIPPATPWRPRRIGKISTTKYALSNVKVRDKRLKEALRDLRVWRNNYAELAALSPDLPELFAVIKRTLKKHDDHR
jgi:D-alanyl-D-alanine carboxypeptidase